jgi:hypothetical protein
MPRIIQTLQPINVDEKDKRPLVLNSMDYHEAVYEAARHLKLSVVMDDSTEQTYSHCIGLMEDELAKNGWRIETSKDYPYFDDLHMMSLYSQRNENKQ